jgi:hypothetical protein
MLFRRGWNAVQVQRWLGQHEPSFTLDTYVHLLEADVPTPQFSDALLARRGADAHDALDLGEDAVYNGYVVEGFSRLAPKGAPEGNQESEQLTLVVDGYPRQRPPTISNPPTSVRESEHALASAFPVTCALRSKKSVSRSSPIVSMIAATSSSVSSANGRGSSSATDLDIVQERKSVGNARAAQAAETCRKDGRGESVESAGFAAENLAAVRSA